MKSHARRLLRAEALLAFGAEIAVAIYAARLAMKRTSAESSLRVAGVLLFLMAVGAIGVTAVRFGRDVTDPDASK